MTTLLSILLIKVINSKDQQEVISNLVTSDNELVDPFSNSLLDRISTLSTNLNLPNNLEVKDITVDLSSIQESIKIDPLYYYKDVLASVANNTYLYLCNMSSPQTLKIYMFCCCVVVISAVTIKTIYIMNNIYCFMVGPILYTGRIINTTMDTTKQVVLYTADTSKQVVMYTADTFKAGFIKTSGFLFDMSKIVLKIIFNHLI
jgi:hypothetical protein